jgi:hypothetical protein
MIYTDTQDLRTRASVVANCLYTRRATKGDFAPEHAGLPENHQNWEKEENVPDINIQN